jgi:hypothetical protein
MLLLMSAYQATYKQSPSLLSPLRSAFLVLMYVGLPCMLDGMTFVLRKEGIQHWLLSRYHPNAHLK